MFDVLLQSYAENYYIFEVKERKLPFHTGQDYGHCTLDCLCYVSESE